LLLIDAVQLGDDGRQRGREDRRIEGSQGLSDHKADEDEENALVAVITKELGFTEPSDKVRFYVRFALHIQLSATREADPEPTIDAGFRLLDAGWAHYQESSHVRNARRVPDPSVVEPVPR
jgi:hypothetical protein